MSREYNGWKLLDKIIIVLKASNHYKYGCKQGYIVDPSNKKQLENAKNWGATTVYEIDEQGNYKKDSDGNYIQHIEEAEVIETDNCNFQLTLLDSAGESSQGGKLSFWNCLIEKGDIKCVVGINSDLLLELMLQSTFTNGACKEKVVFARKNGNVGVLHTKMKQYIDALNDKQLRVDVSTKKTTKWQIGHNYITLTQDDIYLGKLFQPIRNNWKYLRLSEIPSDIRDKVVKSRIESREKNSASLYSSYVDLVELNVDKGRQVNIVANNYSVAIAMERKVSNNEKLEELMSIYHSALDSSIKSNNESKQAELGRRYNLVPYNTIPFFKENAILKTPSRKQGDTVFEMYDNYERDVTDILNSEKEALLKLLKEKHILVLPSLIPQVIKSLDGSITDLDIELIKYILESQKKQEKTVYKLVYNNEEQYIYDEDEVFNKIKEMLK